MISVSILADEARIPLDKAGFAGAVAVIRPMDIVDVAKWRDAFPTDDARNAAGTELVRSQLQRIDGLEMRGPDGSSVPYDHANPKHFRSIPIAMRNAIYFALMERVNVSGEQEKNSGAPSGSDGTVSQSAEAKTPGATPRAVDPAPSEPATS